MDYIEPLSETRERPPFYRVQYYIDEDKYSNSILAHASITTAMNILVVLAFDTLLCNCTQHACGMLSILA